MARVVRVGGYLYVNAPSTGYWHGFPDDNYRFYRGAVAALAFWYAAPPSLRGAVHPACLRNVSLPQKAF